jgi:Tol biopolymer transport system component
MKRVLLFIIFSAVLQLVYSQNEEQNYYIAEDFLEDEDWNQAIDIYMELLSQDPNNGDLNFRLGFCYLNTPFEKDKAAFYLKRASEQYSRRKRAKNNAPLETFYYLGKAYQMTYKFEEAIEEYNYLNNRVKGVDKNFRAIILHEIERATNGLGYYLNPIEYTLLDSFPCLNSAYSDYSPVVSANDSVFFFTSKRLENIGEDVYASGQKMEDIYLVQYRNGVCDTAYNAGAEFNSAGNDAAVGLSPDGRMLFLYKEEDLGALYFSKFVAGKWTIPEKFPEPVNSALSRETSASLSADGKSLYFTSDRKKGYGGLDIYMSRILPNGEWSEPENLGPSVNTEFDEESPYLFADGSTLFFASKGHRGMGGYDLFFINLDRSGKWPGAINLGYPVNSPDDDAFIVPLADGKTFYIASKNLSGKPSWPDIYKIQIPFMDLGAVTMYNGKLSICDGNLPKAQIDLYNAKTKEHYSTTFADVKSGQFSFCFPSQKTMQLSIIVDGAVVFSDTIASSIDFRSLSKEFKLRANAPCDTLGNVLRANLGNGFLYKGLYYNKIITLDPIYFLSGVSHISSAIGLDELIAFLIRNRDTIIEVAAYADTKGPAAYNQSLTEIRANAAKKYMIEKGVLPEQVVARGYGENLPIAYEYDPKSNYNPQAAKYNRRLEVKVLKQGKERLYIRQKFDIPEDLRI